MKQHRKKKICLRPGCGKIVFARGLCQIDYNTARTLILNGKTTWELLEEKGKSTKANFAPTGEVTTWLLETSKQ